MKTNRIGVVFTLLLVVLLGACGAGGGGGGGGGSAAIPPHWGTPQRIDSGDVNEVASYMGPGLAVDSAGVVTVAWVEIDEIEPAVWANQFSGGSWGAAEMIDSQGFGESLFLTVLANGPGSATVVWNKLHANPDRSVWANHVSAGVWGTPQRIESQTQTAGFSCNYPVAVMDGSGNVTVAWQLWNDTRYFTWVNRYGEGTWGTELNIDLADLGSSEAPRIVVDGAGDVTVAWHRFDGTRYNVWANRYSGGWGAAVMLDTEDLGHAQTPAVVVDGTGFVTAVWTQSDGTRSNVWANRFSEGSWGTAGKIESEDLGDAVGPLLVADSDGNVTAVWAQLDGTRYNLWANRHSGGSWGIAQLIESEDLGDAWPASLVADPTGNVTVAWSQFDGTRTNAWANRFSGGSWGTAQKIQSEPGDVFYPPFLVVDNAGKVAAIWSQFDGTRSTLWASGFSGGSWGAAQKVEFNDLGDINYLAVVMDGAGTVTAVWPQFDGARYSLWAVRSE
jgi:hypothetical protein